MRKFRLIEIAVILNILVMIFNICIALYNLWNGNTTGMIFSVGMAICNGLTGIICAIVSK